MQVVPLGSQGLEVSRLGLGCMVMSGMYGTPDAAEAVATFERAIDLGVTFFDTADAYSAGENEQFVGRVAAAHRGEIKLATKFGLVPLPDGSIGVNGQPDYVRECCEGSLRRLATDHIDLYYLHRPDPQVPIEETIGAMSELVAAGKVRYLGVSEVSPDELRRAHGVHPLSALQSEWSLWERAIERHCVPAARELGIGIVPYAPLGRGFLTGAITDQSVLGGDDLRAHDPRLVGENLRANLRLVEVIREMAAAARATPAQIALAWLCAQGDDVVPIPGTERREYLEDNVGSLAVTFRDEELGLLDGWFRDGVTAGDADELLQRRWKKVEA